MLGILLLYFIGKEFYNLAGRHNKNKWLFAIAGVVVYYGGIFAAQVAILLYMEYSQSSMGSMTDLWVGLMSIPVGLAVCWGFHYLLKKQWSKPVISNEKILDREIK